MEKGLTLDEKTVICTLPKYIIMHLFTVVGTVMEKSDDSTVIRRPQFAGSFYPNDPNILRRDVEKLLEQNALPPVEGCIRAMIAPHAGYKYSGAVAAAGYGQLADRSVKTVVLVAPSHRYFAGVSVYPGDAYQTPLGAISVDLDIINTLAAPDVGIERSTRGHGEEHSLEVQLPFLQVALGEFKLAPVVIGEQRPNVCRELGKRLMPLLDDEHTVLIASSDLSHMHPYEEAQVLDRRIVDRVERFDIEGFETDWITGASEACGGGPILATWTAAHEHGADKSKVLMYRNSGDITGDHSAVVGYLSAVFYKDN
jgi:MEMO1 family protein